MRKVDFIFLFFLWSLLLVGLLKNISFPLLWADEAETMVFAQRILRFGYPKIDDGKNIVSQFEIGKLESVVRENGDVYIGTSWGQNYFGVLGVVLASKTQDIYLKTGLARAPFTLAGFLGLAIMASSVLMLFGKRKRRKIYFLVFFVIFEATSIYMNLHLRQARAHPLSLLVFSCLFFVFVRYHFLGKMNSRIYAACFTLLFLLLFTIFYPVYFIFLATVSFWEVSKILAKLRDEKMDRRNFIFSVLENQNLRVVLFSLILVLPLVVFFRTSTIFIETSQHYHSGLSKYWQTLRVVFSFFLFYEMLLPVLVSRGFVIFFWQRFGDKINNQESRKVLNITSFLSIFFLVYVLIMAGSPFFYFRYYLVLQPTLVIIFLLDVFLIKDWLDKKELASQRQKISQYFWVAVLSVMSIVISSRVIYGREYLYEITHQYKGPLDYAIPYVMEHFSDSEKLIIATNYEENAFVYYLGSKTIIGHAGNNLLEDKKLDPDVIIPRKHRPPYLEEVYDFLEKNSGRFEKVSFEVFDYPVNNAPDLLVNPTHLFRTQYADRDEDKLEVYFKKDNYD